MTLAGWELTLLLVLDADRALADLSGGRLVCGDCAGRLQPWGWAVRRPVREAGGRLRWLRPRRACCGGCGRTHVLLPASCVPRRRDAARSVVTALTRAATGVGHRPIAAELGVPAATVRGWLRQARARAEELRCVASVAAHRMDPMLGPIEPQGSPLADAVEALGVAAAAAVRRGLWPVPPEPAALVLVLSRGRLVAGCGVR